LLQFNLFFIQFASAAAAAGAARRPAAALPPAGAQAVALARLGQSLARVTRGVQ